MNEELFNLIILNQQKWSEDYKLQKELARKEYNKKVLDSKWYGNSKEYKRLWYKNKAMINK